MAHWALGQSSGAGKPASTGTRAPGHAGKCVSVLSITLYYTVMALTGELLRTGGQLPESPIVLKVNILVVVKVERH